MTACRSVAERVVLEEPLAELAAHVATCSRCRRLVAMPDQLANRPRAALDPGLGFSARMTAAAQQRIAIRRRRRIATTLAATVAACAVGVFVVTRPANESRPQPAAMIHRSTPATPATPPPEQPVAIEDSDLADLMRLADTRHARRASAPWGRIQKPLAPYRKLVKGVTP
jgi:hypothetical protein